MRRRQLGVLLAAVACLVGCGSRPDRGAVLSTCRRLHLAPVISGGLADRAFHLDPAVRAAATRSLASRGYQVVTEGDSEATVRVAWILGRDRSPTGEGERTLSLSLSIFSPAGERLYSGRSNLVLAERHWTEDRTASEVTLLLREVPMCQPSVTPVEGKPALAPVRLQ